jgi:hypothetical protein
MTDRESSFPEAFIEEIKSPEAGETPESSDEEEAEAAGKDREKRIEEDKLLSRMDELTSALYGAKLLEGGLGEEEKVAEELDKLRELKEAKLCEPPCEPFETMGDEHKRTNGSYILRLGEKGEMKGIFKPETGEVSLGEKRDLGLRPGIEPKSGFKREWLAFMVDRALDLGVTPPTVLRREKQGIGSLQVWLPEAKTYAEGGPEAALNEEEARKIALFDYLIGSQDRHGGNFMVDRSGKAHAIDNGLSFGRGLTYELFGQKERFPTLAVRSEPLEMFNPKKFGEAAFDPTLPEKVGAGLEKFLQSDKTKEALHECFKILGEDAEVIWQHFTARVEEMVTTGRLPDNYDEDVAQKEIESAFNNAAYIFPETTEKAA